MKDEMRIKIMRAITARAARRMADDDLLRAHNKWKAIKSVIEGGKPMKDENNAFLLRNPSENMSEAMKKEVRAGWLEAIEALTFKQHIEPGQPDYRPLCRFWGQRGVKIGFADEFEWVGTEKRWIESGWWIFKWCAWEHVFFYRNVALNRHCAFLTLTEGGSPLVCKWDSRDKPTMILKPIGKTEAALRCGIAYKF